MFFSNKAQENTLITFSFEYVEIAWNGVFSFDQLVFNVEYWVSGDVHVQW